MSTAFDYRRFFLLGEGFLRGAVRAHPIGETPDSLALTRAETVPQQPLLFHHDEGTQLKDYMGTTGLHALISDRVIELLRNSLFTGWTTYPVSVSDEEGDLVPGYHGLAVTRRCGPIDDDSRMMISRSRL